MGASLMKLTPGNEERKKRVIEEYYNMYLKEGKMGDFKHFYQAVCKTVEAINDKFGNTQIRIPEISVLEREFKRYSEDHHGVLTPGDFQEILKRLVSMAGFTSAGALDSFLYILSAPTAALLIKNAVNPKAVSNQVLIPGVTSATVLVLYALRKI